MEYNCISLRDYVGEALVECDCKNLVVLDSDLAKSTTSVKFRNAHPERFIECGISESSAMSIATGLATEGKIPFVVNFSLFVTGSAWTQLRQACYANANIKLLGTHPGMDDGPDGASHHANEDIAISRVLPNLRILIPDSLEDLKTCVQLAIEHNGPVFIRCSRDVVPDGLSSSSPITWGKLKMVFDEGNDIAVFYEGTAAKTALEGYEALKQKGYSCKLIGINSVKPVDQAEIKRIAENVKGIVTVENHSILGGLGSIISETLAQLPTHAPVRAVGVNDVFTESGKTSEVKQKYGLTPEHIVQCACDILQKRTDEEG